ncbi:helix-turn-helix transcriptional regulator [Alistipes sp.]|uniref:helix-turn-helix transcriptional regulator n=1 Tax=Alistipes sp. TaxID=1872444 RepID=UPI0025BE0BE1|nr:WYL domain-containing protein [Alistipes sp.]
MISERLKSYSRVTIRHDKLRGYYIDERYGSAEDYEVLLLNFELLNAIDSDSTIQKYVLPEHHRAIILPDIAELLDAIRNRHPVEFDYTLVRHGGKVVRKHLHPYFLKESQQRWYLIGYDVDDKLKAFGLDRFSSLRILFWERFKRDDTIDIPALFRESYGIWNNPEDPVEEIVIKYDALDGAFVKTMPLHTTQELLDDTPDGITIRLRLRITNDFVMALLTRSRSVEVVKPTSLRKQVYKVYQEALERNKIDLDEA